VYYLTVASADNWSGAVCSLGRYAMPVVPLAAALVAVALDRTASRRAALGLALSLAAWTGLIAVRLWPDPLASNDCAVLLGKSTFADGNVYIPNLFIKTWSEGAPGLLARIAVWIALAAAVAVWMWRVERNRSESSPVRVLGAVTVVVLAAAFLLERWPSAYAAPRFRDGLDLGGGTSVFVLGADVREDFARVPSSEVDLLVRSRAPLTALTLIAEGEGVLRSPDRAPIALSPQGTTVDLPLTPLSSLMGRRGVAETLYRRSIVLDGPRGAVLRFGPPTFSAAARPGRSTPGTLPQ
jgi:hypothetical protein